MRRRFRKKLLWGAGGAVLLVGLAGVLHIPLARSLGAGCPFEANAPETAADRDAQRKRATAVLRAEEPAPARPALHFVLRKSTRTDVQTWAEHAGAVCGPGLDPLGLACDGVEDGETVGTLHADFDALDALVALSFVSRTTAAERASAGIDGAVRGLEPTIGQPSRVSGDRTPAYLAAGPLRQARVEYRHSDYFAAVSATNMGSSGYLVTQVYRAID